MDRPVQLLPLLATYAGAAGDTSIPAGTSGALRAAATSQLGLGKCRTAPPRRGPGATLAGVPPEPTAGLPLELVLRAFPGLGRQAGRDDASGTPRRRETLCRLRRADRNGDRPPQWRGPSGIGVRRSARDLQLGEPAPRLGIYQY